jgi:hypothetical protein
MIQRAASVTFYQLNNNGSPESAPEEALENLAG